MTFEVYFNTRMELQEFAYWLRDLLNLRSTNRSTYQSEQDRYGANYGGAYYLFEVLGLELILLQNRGDSEIPERSGFPLYLIVRSGHADVDQAVARHISTIVRREGIAVAVDSLSA